jgi:hypothetical protein
MNIENTIIASVIHERCRLVAWAGPGSSDERHINHYGRKMIRFAESGRIRPTDSNEDIAVALSSGFMMWLFWQIAPELLLWIVQAIRNRIWQQEPQH